VIVNGWVRQVDIGEINGRIFRTTPVLVSTHDVGDASRTTAFWPSPNGSLLSGMRCLLVHIRCMRSSWWRMEKQRGT
jgi:hypothetical protein